MVQDYKSQVWVYKYPFELVMAAYERRFPSCELLPQFVGSEILREEVSPDRSMHIAERRCKIKVDVPFILRKIVGVDYIYFIQVNTLDRLGRTLKIEATNESFANRIAVKEYCTYYVHPENPDWTCFEQSARLEVTSFFNLESLVEKLAAKQYAQSISKAKEVTEHYIDILRKEGKTQVERFKASSTSSPTPSQPSQQTTQAYQT